MKKIITGLFLFSILLTGCVDNYNAAPNSSVYQEPATKKEVKINYDSLLKDTEVKKETPKADTTNLSNDNHYINVDGEKVHSPAFAPSIPAGASAKCQDGTYSFSQNRRGTCSHHGGVATWY